MTDPDMLAAALAWHHAGCCVLPAMLDGTKRPALREWKSYQVCGPDTDTVTAWFTGGHPGLGVLCGAVSGNLEMLELEGRAIEEGALDQLVNLLEAAGLAALWHDLNLRGYVEHTPSGGLHLLYRITDTPVPGNMKLARRPATEAELDANPAEKMKVLAETRGEGGWVVVAPSHGPAHASREPWTAIAGPPSAILTISAVQRDELIRVVRCLDQMPPPEPVAPEPPRLRAAEHALAPGDDYEQRTDWADLLTPLGWTALFRRAGRTYWRRPGKNTPGISATTGGAQDGRDRLYVFSSATPFDTERPYTLFGAYTLLHHGGDHSAAARELRRRGYGGPVPAFVEQAAAIADLVPGPPPATRVLAAVDGTAARVIEPTPSSDPIAYGATEDGMALALVARHGDQLRYCPQRGAWLHWDTHRWAWDDGEHHREHIRTLARELPADDGWKAFHKRALSAAGVTGIARLAQSDRRITVPLSHLDADPWALNTPDGVIDLRTGNVTSPDPRQLVTRSTTCAADPTADPGVWLKFLNTTFGGDEELIGYLQRLVGYSAVGYVGPHILPFCHGSGGNGKGVFLEAIAGVLGDYATTAPAGFLMAKPHTEHLTELARLAGARMVICSEVNESDSFDEQKVKQLTGGDSITARFMRADHFTFTPTHQLWLMGNHKPAVRSGGHSFWRRLRLVPFLHEVPEEQVVDDLQGQLVHEHGPAILAWIAAGAASFAAGGLREPDTVKAATAEYAKDQDTVAQFVEERCILGGAPAVKIKASIVREAYEHWCFAQGEKPVTAKTLSTTLRGRFGVELVQGGKGIRFYAGITVLVDDEDEPRESDGGWVR